MDVAEQGTLAERFNLLYLQQRERAEEQAERRAAAEAELVTLRRKLDEREGRRAIQSHMIKALEADVLVLQQTLAQREKFIESLHGECCAKQRQRG